MSKAESASWGWVEIAPVATKWLDMSSIQLIMSEINGPLKPSIVMGRRPRGTMDIDALIVWHQDQLKHDPTLRNLEIVSSGKISVAGHDAFVVRYACLPPEELEEHQMFVSQVTVVTQDMEALITLTTPIEARQKAMDAFDEFLGALKFKQRAARPSR